MNRRVAVRGIIVRDGKLLALRLKQYEDKATSSNDYWRTAGGGVDIGEPPIPALERELVEFLSTEPLAEDVANPGAPKIFSYL